MLPHQLKLSGNQSLQFLSKLIKNGFPSHTLDLSEVKFVTPVICVLCEAARFLKKEINYPIEFDSWDYLIYMGNASTSSERYISTYNIADESYIPNTVKKFQELFQDWLSYKSCFFMEYAFNELMENVFHHAQSKPGLWIQAQKYPKVGALEMALADLGIGIAESMKNNPVYRNIDPNNRFVIALNTGVTSKPERHSGEGLSCVLEWIKKNPGAEGVVISLKNVWFKIKNEVGIYHSQHLIFPGTFLWFKMPREATYSLADIWNQLNLKPEPSI